MTSECVSVTPLLEGYLIFSSDQLSSRLSIGNTLSKIEVECERQHQVVDVLRSVCVESTFCGSFHATCLAVKSIS